MGVGKISFPLLGQQFGLVTDRCWKYLGSKPISDLSARLQRFRMFMLGFDYDAVSLAGMYNHACLVVQVGDSEESFCVVPR